MTVDSDTRFFFHAAYKLPGYPTVEFYYEAKLSGRSIAELIQEINAAGYTEKEIGRRLGFKRGYIAAVKQGRREATMKQITINEWTAKIYTAFPDLFEDSFDLEGFVDWCQKAVSAGTNPGLTEAYNITEGDFDFKAVTTGLYHTGARFYNKQKKYHKYIQKTLGDFDYGAGNFPDL